MRGLERYIGEVLDAKYRIEKLLGQGGMGAVYLATHLGTERPVALKIIAPEFMRNDEFIERFKREAKAAGRLRHPNVVDVTDFGFAHRGDERLAYLVMEYLDGCTLADVLAEESRLPLDWVVDILEQVCSAVDEAHQQGIVHRDLKPDNIWLEPNRRGGYTIKVLDFGVAKLAGERGELVPPFPLETNTQTSPTRQATSPASLQPSSQMNETLASENPQVASPTVSSLTDTEASTLIFNHSEAAESVEQRAPLSAEAPTQLLQPVAAKDYEKTLLLERETQDKSPATSTASQDVLTQIGSLLGTPLYMSPEQCRGEPLDASSDIYSLGVITFQMLAGETPFSGDMHTVMRLHQEAPAPSLREKNPKVPKKVGLLVESALAKNPAERPLRAAAFASALRANSEGVGSLLRRSFALYSEYFPKFLRLSLLAHIPVVLMTALLVSFDVAEARDWFPQPVEIIFQILFGFLAVVVNFLTNSVIVGITVLIVTQLILAPLRPVEIRPAFAIMKKRWRAFFSTSIRVGWRLLVGFILLIVPGIVMMIRYVLYAPTVLLEGLEKKAALKRARELVSRSRRTVVVVVFLQLSIPLIISSIAATLASIGVEDTSARAAKIYGRFLSLLSIFIAPLLSIMVALLYMKLRHMGGEPLKDTLDQLEGDVMPRSRWQQRARQRLYSRGTSRH
jgi:serine/threonine protein kinase